MDYKNGTHRAWIVDVERTLLEAYVDMDLAHGMIDIPEFHVQPDEVEIQAYGGETPRIGEKSSQRGSLEYWLYYDEAMSRARAWSGMTLTATEERKAVRIVRRRIKELERTLGFMKAHLCGLKRGRQTQPSEITDK